MNDYPDGNRLCVAIGDNVWFVNPKSNKLIKIGKSHDNTVNTIELSPSGKFVATGSGDLCVYLWDPITGFPIKSFVGHRQAPKFITFSNDERWLASADASGIIKIWDIQTGGELLELRDFQGSLKGLDFHQNENGHESLFALGVKSFDQATANLNEWFVFN